MLDIRFLKVVAVQSAGLPSCSPSPNHPATRRRLTQKCRLTGGTVIPLRLTHESTALIEKGATTAGRTS